MSFKAEWYGEVLHLKDKVRGGDCCEKAHMDRKENQNLDKM